MDEQRGEVQVALRRAAARRPRRADRAARPPRAARACAGAAAGSRPRGPRAAARRAPPAAAGRRRCRRGARSPARRAARMPAAPRARAAGTGCAMSTITSPTSTTSPATALAAQVVDGRLRRAQQQVAGVVGQHAVELLGHRAVERAHAGLDVRDGDARLRGGKRRRRASSSCRRRRGPGRARRSASSGASAASMRAVCSVFVPPWMPQLDARGAARRARATKIGGQLVVVVLAGVDEQLVVLLAQQPRDRRRLDELRAVADDRDDVHAASAARMRSATAPPPRARQRARAPRARASSMRATGCTSRSVEARNASLDRAQVVARRDALLRAA